MTIPANDEYSEKLYKDVYDVFVGRTKNIHEFSEDYQDVLKNAYRFCGVRYESKIGKTALRTNDTMDII